MTQSESDKNLFLIAPEEGVINSYKEMEVSSIKRIKNALANDAINLKDSDFILAQLGHNIIKQVNNMRRQLKNEVSFRVKIFRDISADKAELKAYIKATYPRIVR